MSEINNTIEIKKNQYHHLTKDDRAKIQSLIEQVDENGKRLFNNSYIANYIGVHKSTITRELRRIKSKLNIRSGKRKNKPYNAMMLKKITNLKEQCLEQTTFLMIFQN